MSCPAIASWNVLVVGSSLVGDEDARAHVNAASESLPKPDQRQGFQGDGFAVAVHASVNDDRF